MTKRNQGEGNREAAREYNEGVRRHIRDHDVEKEARDARPKDKKEARKLQEAEDRGRSKAKEFDPQVHRDR